jgi:excisionase family DNA binding protein
MMNSDSPRDTYTVAEVAARLGVSDVTVYAACNRGEIPTLRLGKRYLIPRRMFEGWFAQVGTSAAATMQQQEKNMATHEANKVAAREKVVRALDEQIAADTERAAARERAKEVKK